MEFRARYWRIHCNNYFCGVVIVAQHSVISEREECLFAEIEHMTQVVL